MRQLRQHRLLGGSELNDLLRVEVVDDPGVGGASHEYLVTLLDQELQEDETCTKECCTIRFQKGPVQEVGVNGMSNEVLLAIVLDRLLGFQVGPFACQENAEALGFVQNALLTLHTRTMNRVARGVEGRSVP